VGEGNANGISLSAVRGSGVDGRWGKEGMWLAWP
jgi:hypothetical protein